MQNLSQKYCTYRNDKYDIEKNILIPFKESVPELAHILITQHNLPVYTEKGNLHILHQMHTYIRVYFRINSRFKQVYL